MSGYKAAVYPEPDRRDTARMKEFFNLKYKQKRFAQNEESESDDSDDDTKKKKKKEEKKQKKSHKKEESGSESDTNEDKKKAESTGKGGFGKLMAPPGKKATTIVEK